MRKHKIHSGHCGVKNGGLNVCFITQITCISCLNIISKIVGYKIYALERIEKLKTNEYQDEFASLIKD